MMTYREIARIALPQTVGREYVQCEYTAAFYRAVKRLYPDYVQMFDADAPPDVLRFGVPVEEGTNDDH